jgi:hypothetical protein
MTKLMIEVNTSSTFFSSPLVLLRNALAMLELGTSEAGAHGTWSLVSHWEFRDNNPIHST